MSEHKKILKESIRKALINGLLDDKSFVYMFALEYARKHHSDSQVILSAMENVCRIMDIICSDSQEDSEKPKDDGLEITDEIIQYLASLRIQLLPLDFRKDITVELGELAEPNAANTGVDSGAKHDPLPAWPALRALDNHWLGLYFNNGPQKNNHQAQTSMQRGGSPSHPVMVETTTLNFVDTDLRDTKIDLISLSLSYNFDVDQVKGCTSILYLSFMFQGCLVKNMELLFLRHINHFPGTITLEFENCADFDETEFPYLEKELGGKRYYLNLENLALSQEQESFKQHFYNMLQASNIYKYEHLR